MHFFFFPSSAVLSTQPFFILRPSPFSELAKHHAIESKKLNGGKPTTFSIRGTSVTQLLLALTPWVLKSRWDKPVLLLSGLLKGVVNQGFRHFFFPKHQLAMQTFIFE